MATDKALCLTKIAPNSATILGITRYTIRNLREHKTQLTQLEHEHNALPPTCRV